MKVNTYKISNDSIAKAQILIDEGLFSDFTKIINFSMILFLESLNKGIVKTEHLVRTDTTSKSIRINEKVMQKIVDKKIYNRMEIPDYALKYYLDWHDNPPE